MVAKIKFILFIVFATLTVQSANAQYPGTNLRGKIVSADYYGTQYPLTYANVDLYYLNPQTQQWIIVQQTLTDAYGFYFFSYVQPNYTYAIQVNGDRNYNISVVMIDYNYYQYQDLPLFIY
ncbi:MAG: hypothetical protein HKN48_07460 [Flavobacteriaceae bacterium]|nr:hypothetical protein [Flavobacteriaceae bacterium]